MVVSCIGVAWKAYSLPYDWTVGNELLRHTLGSVSINFPVTAAESNSMRQILIGLHVWATMESYEVLGIFGAHVFCYSQGADLLSRA
jgi:phosphatidylethanolamine N-methyltransferase